MQKVISKLQRRVSQSREKGINIMEKIKSLWLGFAEKHPGASKWIREGGLFVIVSNLITVLKYFMLLFLPLAFAGLPKVDFGFPGIDITLFGETFKWNIIGYDFYLHQIYGIRNLNGNSIEACSIRLVIFYQVRKIITEPLRVLLRKCRRQFLRHIFVTDNCPLFLICRHYCLLVLIRGAIIGHFF